MNLLQRPASVGENATNGHASTRARDPRPIEAPPGYRVDLRDAVTSVPAQGQPSATAGQQRVSSSAEVEEFFECYVEGMDEQELRLRVVSSEGQEAIATMPIERVPEGERRHLEVGVPLRITIFLERVGKQVRREQQVRVLRPPQWKVPLSEQASQQLTAYYERRLQAVLHPSE